MTDDSLERDGYSPQPPLLRSVALLLVAGVVAVSGVPRWVPILLVVAAMGQVAVFVVRHREQRQR